MRSPTHNIHIGQVWYWGLIRRMMVTAVREIIRLRLNADLVSYRHVKRRLGQRREKLGMASLEQAFLMGRCQGVVGAVEGKMTGPLQV